MREILFRGKRIDNGEWVYGDLINNHDGRKFVGEVVVDDYKGTANDTYEAGIGFVEVDPETVGQFTGLTDKNGKKIFEGDIVEAHDNLPFFDGCNSEEICYNGKVMYTDDQGMYVCEGNENGNALCALNLDECVVIGNAIDNPELLEVIE